MEENVIQINGGITINVDVSVKNIYVKKSICGILLRVVCKNNKYLASIIDDSMITGGDTIEETKTIPANFNEKNIPVKYKIYIFYLLFLLITIALLIAASIYCQATTS